MRLLLLTLSAGLLIGCSKSTDVANTIDEQNAVELLSVEDIDDTDAGFRLTSADQEAHLNLLDEMLNDENTQDDEFIRLIKDLGGMLEYSVFLDEASEHEIRDKYSQYGLSYEVIEPVDNQSRASQAPNALLENCDKFIPSNYRNKTWKIKGRQWSSIDASGRPLITRVERTLFGNKLTAGTEVSSCQKKVRDYGGRGPENGGTDQAGHLVAKALSGYGTRVNLTPQNKNTNNTIFNGQIERILRDCNRKSRRYINYWVYARYGSNPNATRPQEYIAEAVVGRFRGILYRTKRTVARINNESPDGIDTAQAAKFVADIKSACGL